MDRSPGRSRSGWLYLALSAIILFRTLPWLVWGKETTDSDEALIGLMANHIALGKDLPIFRWGCNYLFAASSYLAAPLFRLFGPSVAMMRLPMLALNLAVGNLLAFLLRRDCKLSARETFVCCLWFALPSMFSARGLVLATDGATEALFFLLLCWLLREKPLRNGLLSGIGYAIRPFAVYGMPAIWLIDWRKNGFRHAFSGALRWALGLAASYGLIELLARRSALYMGINEPVSRKRFIFMLEDVRGFFAEILTRTTGLQIQRLNPVIARPVDSRFNVLGLALAALGAYLVFLLLRFSWRNRRELWRKLGDRELQLGFYLALIGAACFAAYVVFSPPSDDIRYTYDLIFGLVGLYALLAKIGAGRLTRQLALVLVLGATLNNLYANAAAIGMMRRYASAHPSDELIAFLHQRGIRAFVAGEYFHAGLNLTLISGETVLASNGTLNPPSYYPPYDRAYLATPPESRAKIQLVPCPGGSGGHAVGYWYVCPAP